ncbi:MAG: uracil-DNA glycosylase family protein [Prevotellaceae bacterium]|nr:uracil-DNA glycosylase family protein [Prevotellaceae bacterium]
MSESYLNVQAVARNTESAAADGDCCVEYHPLIPFLPENAKVLFLGSFPPQRKKWCCDFYYPNFINDHWRIEGQVFYGDKEYFVEKDRRCFRLDAIIEHCKGRGIAFYDTATVVRRLKGNASDKFLEVVEATDIRNLIKPLEGLRAVITTGEKATETICGYYGIDAIPKVNGACMLDGNVELYRLPSSSRAYPLAFEKKVDAYRAMFDKYGV